MVFPQQTKRDATMFRMWVTMTIKDTKNISNVVYLINLSVFKFDSNKHLKGHQSAKAETAQNEQNENEYEYKTERERRKKELNIHLMSMA